MGTQPPPNFYAMDENRFYSFTPGSITRRYIIALSLIALLLVAAQVLVLHSLDHQEDDSRKINMAGRQRLLTQSLRRASLIILTASNSTILEEGLSEMKNNMDEWNSAHEFLLSRADRVHGIPEEVERLFEKMEPHRLAMLKSVRMLMVTRGKGSRPDLQAGPAADVIYHGGYILDIMDKVVAAYELDSRNAMQRLRTVEIVLTVVLITVLALEAVFIFRPAVQRIKRDMARLQRATNQLWLLSQYDGLTGVPNRRAFDERLAEEWSRAIREQHNLALIMLDIDHFKLFNDHYGHLAGDDALCQVARAVQAELKRPADFLARYGGEEFCLVLPGTSLEGALMLAERMRQRVEALDINQGWRPLI